VVAGGIANDIGKHLNGQMHMLAGPGAGDRPANRIGNRAPTAGTETWPGNQLDTELRRVCTE
jgi:hypothetical protein